MYMLYQPFEIQLAVENVKTMTELHHIDSLTQQIRENFDQLYQQMMNRNINLRPNKIYVQCFDIDYTFPVNYDFIKQCMKFIDSTGFIVFNHLNNFTIVEKFIGHKWQELSKVQHPLTGDTLWHLNPFFIDMFQGKITDIYNLRGESPNERRLLAELMNYPNVGKFPLDVTNSWNNQSRIFVNNDCTITSHEPLGLCKHIKPFMSK